VGVLDFGNFWGERPLPFEGSIQYQELTRDPGQFLLLTTRGTGAPAQTTTSFDAMGRATNIVQPDGASKITERGFIIVERFISEAFGAWKLAF
jgi:hypothetical protein